MTRTPSRKGPRRGRRASALREWRTEGGPFKPAEFFARAHVFRREEFVDAHVKSGRSPRTSAALLAYHVAAGHIRSLRRGLYGTTGLIDPWVLGSRLTTDAVIAYDGALSFHDFTGLGHSLSYLTAERATFFHFNEVVYRAVRDTRARFVAGIEAREREGQLLRVTSRERTFVDCLDRLELGPGAVELWRLFSRARGLDLDAMVRCAEELQSQVVAARLAFFLQNTRDVPGRLLDRLERHRPRSPAYFDRKHHTGGRFLARWNLVVPSQLLDAVH